MDDKPYTKFKTRKIRRLISNRYTTLELNETERLFRICAGMGPQGAVFAGNLFEGLAIRYTSGESPPSPDTFGLFTEMKKAPTANQKFPIRFNYIRPGHKWAIIVKEDQRVVFKGSPLEQRQYAFRDQKTTSSTVLHCRWHFLVCPGARRVQQQDRYHL